MGAKKKAAWLGHLPANPLDHKVAQYLQNPLIRAVSLTTVVNVEMARRKVFGNERISPDGETMMRDALSPGGTLLDTQTLADTPHKQNKAWQCKVPPSATAGEAAKLRKANGQSCRDARKKGKHAGESEEAPCESLAVRAMRLGIGQGGPLFGPERRKAQKALSQKVRQAELSVAEQDALNERRRDHRAAEQSLDVQDALNALQIERRAGQSVLVRDALNERRRANEQVTISVRLALRALYTPVRLAVGSRPHNPN